MCGVDVLARAALRGRSEVGWKRFGAGMGPVSVCRRVTAPGRRAAATGTPPRRGPPIDGFTKPGVAPARSVPYRRLSRNGAKHTPLLMSVYMSHDPRGAASLAAGTSARKGPSRRERLGAGGQKGLAWKAMTSPAVKTSRCGGRAEGFRHRGETIISRGPLRTATQGLGIEAIRMLVDSTGSRPRYGYWRRLRSCPRAFPAKSHGECGTPVAGSMNEQAVHAVDERRAWSLLHAAPTRFSPDSREFV